MATADRARWDRQHLERPGSYVPAKFLQDIFESEAWSIPRGRALDIATGKGRNALFLAERGFEVVGIDISPVGLAEARAQAAARSLSIDWQEADLEKIELATDRYKLIVNIDYLQRSLIPHIKRGLEVGGLVIFETYLIEQQTIGHPKNPAYLLGHNELLELFRDFRVLCYREGKFVEGKEPAFRAGLFAKKIA
jgi:SAM-dependent methyltransferase